MRRKIVVRVAAVIVMLAGLLLYLEGKDMTIPSGYLGYGNVEEYINGDAYNYMIAASLVAGRIAGATTAVAIYRSAGILVGCLGLVAFTFTFLRLGEKTTESKTAAVPTDQESVFTTPA